MSGKTRRWVLLTLVAGGVAAGTAYAFRAKPARGIEVELEAAAKRKLIETVTATGRIQPKTQVAISADVSAKITRLPVKEGGWVEKGALLVELDRERHLAAVEMAEARLRAAESNAIMARENMTKAEKDYARTKGLFDQKLESQAQHDSAYAGAQAETARHHSSLDEVEQMRATLKQAQDDLSKTRIFAPIAGTVSKLNKEVGEIALGSQFQKDIILELANLSGMEAVVDVDENDIIRLSLGDAAEIEVDALPGVKLKGEVTEIANSAKVTGTDNTNRKTEFEVKVAVTEVNERLRPGMTASAEITTDTKDGVIGVPIQSVAVRTMEQLKESVAPGAGPKEEILKRFKAGPDGFVSIVFIVQNGKAEAKQVKTGIQSSSHIEVVEGLAEGEQVVTGSYRAISRDLQFGSLVQTKGQGPKAEGSTIARR